MNNKHYFTDKEYQSIFAPYTDELEIYRFEACSRQIVTYRLAG